MKSRTHILLMFILGVFMLSGCARNQRHEKELIIWTDMKEIATLQAAAGRFTKKNAVAVKIVRVPFEELQPKFQVAAPVRHGPDLITGPHNWIGPFATAHLIAPIHLDQEQEQKFLPVSLKVMSFEGELYGLPLCIDTLGLIYNKNYLKKPPQTMKELIEIARELNKGEISGFLFDIKDFYYSWAFFGGYGAYIFKETSKGLDPLDIGLDSPEAVEAAQFLLDLKKKYQLMEQGITKDIADGRFLDNKLAMTINGPWALVDYKKKNIPYGFTRLPMLDNGRYPSPLVGVQGVMLNRRSTHPELALALMKEICGETTQIDIYLEGGRIPSRIDALEDQRISRKARLNNALRFSPAGGLLFVLDVTYEPNEDVKGILDVALVGTPMPNIPPLTTVWQPMKEALQLILMEKLAPGEALAQAAARVRKDIKGMIQ